VLLRKKETEKECKKNVSRKNKSSELAGAALKMIELPQWHKASIQTLWVFFQVLSCLNKRDYEKVRLSFGALTEHRVNHIHLPKNYLHYPLALSF
jgi:hypothetical protein